MFLKITCVRVTATAVFENLFCSGHGAKLFTYNFPLILCNITMGAPLPVLQIRNPRLREAEGVTLSNTDNNSKTWTTNMWSFLTYWTSPLYSELRREVPQDGILCMGFQPGWGCRWDWGLGSGCMEPDAIWGLGRTAEWKADVGGDHSQGLCEGCTCVLPWDTCLRGWQVLSPALTLLTRLGPCRAVATLGMGAIFSFATEEPNG